MIYRLPNKFEFLNFGFSPFFEHFTITQEIYVEMRNKAHHLNRLIELNLMMYNVHIYKFYPPDFEI